MKHAIIRINDISDIDISKISVYDMNNRYIDPEGNMYCLKYNRSIRKIEVIKIVRTHEKDAQGFQQQIIRNKQKETEEIKKMSAAPHHDEDENDEEISSGEEKIFDAYMFVEDSMELMHTHGERLKGIIMNIRNSNIVPRDHKTDSNELEDIFRNIEIDAFQGIEKAENYRKELINYPRSITYYQAKIDKNGREIIDGLSGDTERIMKFIYLYEMFIIIQSLYRSLNKMIKSLSEFLESRNVDENKDINANEKQFYHDAKISIDTTIDDIEKLLDDLKIMEEHVNNPDNF